MFIKSTIGVILIIATFFDCREYRIPNACILELLGLGLIGQILQHGMPGFGYWILGFTLTGMVVIPFVILRMFGAGDAKIWMAMGSCFGWQEMLEYAVFVMAMTGVIAIIKLCRHHIWLEQMKHFTRYLSLSIYTRTLLPYAMDRQDHRTVLPFCLPMCIGYGIWQVYGSSLAGGWLVQVYQLVRTSI